ncbi:hypothetical protein SASPL_109432 [Salvia splendens]|uniref:Uncharacterized protein n=1 Tax=Salvia splendens TaxID=180675 RepID=A0A8X9A7J5_SALSN|nr:hypothetical protein SASPL_109432 [Salvia splendens]
MKKNVPVVMILVFSLILAAMQDQAKSDDTIKNRRLLGDVGGRYSTDFRRKMVEANNVTGDEEDSAPENNTHRLFSNQKPPREFHVDAEILHGDGVEGRVLVDEASEAADDAGSGTESHRLFPEEGRPRNVDSPRHRR